MCEEKWGTPSMAELNDRLDYAMVILAEMQAAVKAASEELERVRAEAELFAKLIELAAREREPCNITLTVSW